MFLPARSIPDDGLIIRNLDQDDVEAVLRISVQLNLSRWSRSDIEKELETEGSLMLIATRDNEQVGFIVGRKVPGTNEGDLDAEIYNIGVIPAHHRTGIGSLLITSFVDTLKGEEIANVWLEVRKGNSSAVSFYKRHGFIEVATRKSFYSHPVEDAIVMCMTL